MVENFDEGPVYLKKDLCLMGSAEEVYIRASYLSAEMIRHMIDEEPAPQPQEGEPTIFRRRKPHQSEIPDLPGLPALYDFVRMLDAEGYPNAFLERGAFRYEFRRAALYNGRILAEVKITPIVEGNS
jgi:methionyl-tRNA formyltransferase